MPSRLLRLLAGTVLVLNLAVSSAPAHQPSGGNGGGKSFSLTLRKQIPTSPGSDRFHRVQQQEDWDPAKTAVIVCDMWDLHHCLNAVRREGEMAPRLNRVLHVARDAGALIIHAPSDCMAFYKDHPARKRATAVPRSENLPADIGQWCRVIPSEEQGEYPIDQTDGGEDDDPEEHRAWAAKLESMGLDPRRPWTRQIDVIDIDANRDVISDRGEEIWSILEQKGIQNVILTGVHTNMCVLGRPFGLRQMAKNGKHVVLMRDLTDTMYNPQRAPFVSHFTGTDLIVAHIEKYVCPTITSDQLLPDESVPFRYSKDHRPHVVIVMAELEYGTERTLPKFALEQLGGGFRVSYVHADEKDRNNLPGAEAIAEADVLLLSVRRRTLPPEQLDYVRKHVAAGKPVVGIRTSSHAFCLRKGEPAQGLADWPQFDAEVFGGNYSNHHGPSADVSIAAAETIGNDAEAILRGVDLAQLKGKGTLYRVNPLAESATPLLIGSIPDKDSEPVAWINRRADGGKSFYTSLGHTGDFEQPAFRALLRNAVIWASQPAR